MILRSLSTAVASIAENTGGGLYAYRCSKAGLNMSMKVSQAFLACQNNEQLPLQSLSVDLADTGVLVMAMHPGWVLTEMGGPNAQITAETCCHTMLQTLAGLADKVRGRFCDINSSVLLAGPWGLPQV